MPEKGERRHVETRAWFIKVHHDLRTSAALRAKPPITDAALFHCQQAVEKALKGYLHWHGRSFPKTHQLGPLGKLCAEVDGSLELLAFRVVDLSGHAVEQRYPGEGPDPDIREARRALKLTKEVVSGIPDRLPRTVRPRGIRL